MPLGGYKGKEPSCFDEVKPTFIFFHLFFTHGVYAIVTDAG